MMSRANSRTPRIGVLLAALAIFLSGAEACPTDLDMDGYANDTDCLDDPANDPPQCSTAECSSCDDPACGPCAHCTHPNATEQPDLVDNDCDGINDEPPVGLIREGYSMQGAATAVVRYGDYVYLASASVIQPFYAPPGDVPVPAGPELELRDWVRDMTVSGDTLFVANRGDGLHAYNLSDPAYPRSAGQVTGLFDAPPFTDIEAVFYDVDVKGNKVAVAVFNYVNKADGGADAVVFDYDPVAETFSPEVTVPTDVRHVDDIDEVPLSIALTGDASGLYIGYGWVGELVYVDLSDPSQSLALPLPDKTEIFVYDIATHGDIAIAAITSVSDGLCSLFSRVHPDGDQLVEEPILMTDEGSSAGAVVDIHGNLVALGTWGVQRYFEEQDNLWIFRITDPETLELEPVAGASTMDWIYQLEVYETPDGPDQVYVADEWGGLEVWELDGSSLTLEVDPATGLPIRRVPTGALSAAVWTDGSKVYSAKRGAALWVFDESAPAEEEVAVEWIDPSDPGCNCEGCECPAPGEYPPAVFAGEGTVNQGRVAFLATNRSDKVGVADGGWFMVFDGAGERYECRYARHEAAFSIGAGHVHSEGELFLASRGYPGLEVYQHCPDAADDIRLVATLYPEQEGFTQPNIIDSAVYGDYIFLLKQTYSLNALLLYPLESNEIQVYRWKNGPLSTCASGQLPAVSFSYLGSFSASTTVVLSTLAIDPEGAYLYAAGDAVYAYDLSAFDPDDVGGLDEARADIAPGSALRSYNTDVTDLMAEPGVVYLVDRLNGLYRYNMGKGQVDRFYPALPDINTNYPVLVVSPNDVVPLFQPVSVARAGSGRLVVQEFTNGRVSILGE